MRQRRRFPNERLVTLVWPSVCGWNAVENLSVVPIKRQRVFQKLLVKRTSRSETMLRGTSCSRTTSLKNSWAVWAASVVLEHAIKWAILLKRSTTTSTTSNCRLVQGKPRTKSKLTSYHRAVGTGSGRYSPVFCLVNFPTVQVEQRPIRWRTSLWRLGH